MPSKYVSSSERLSRMIKQEILALKDSNAELDKFVSSMCIEGFKEKQIEELLEHYHNLDMIKLDKEGNKIYSYL